MSDEELIGKQLGEYRIDALLGQGGMARVYSATDVKIRRQAVIKLIDPPSRDDPGYMARFEREAQIIGQLDHPNIVRLYRYDEQDGWLYMAMQRIDGRDLSELLGKYRADKTFIQPEEARRMIREVCAALDYAHQQGIVHRDVKPANILIDRQGRAFLSDFGLALITDVGTRGEIFGSPHYISPEQAVSSTKAVPQSDLYAIGVILYEMFTGEVPFQAALPLDIAFLQITEPPVPPSELRPEINPELEAVILKALAKKPEARYQSGAALADALDAALSVSAAASLSKLNLPASSPSIAERVALELDEQPLPLIPAAVALENDAIDFTASPNLHIAAPAVAKKGFNRVALGLGMLAVVSLCCLGVVLIAAPMFNNLRAGISPLPVGGGPVETDISATGEPPVKTPPVNATQKPGTAEPVSYTLLIIKDKENLAVFNKSARNFPLGLLRLGDGPVSIRGVDWGVKALAPDTCVGATLQKPEDKDKGKPKQSNVPDCSELGVLPITDKKLWVAEKSFNVYYLGKPVGTCDKKADTCEISWVAK